MLKFGNIYLNFDGTYLDGWTATINPNPLNLPPYTIRLRYMDGVTPVFKKGTPNQVTQSPNVWDLTYNDNHWNDICSGHDTLLEVLGANTSGVTAMEHMFHSCSSLSSVNLFDMSKVTDGTWMFHNCTALSSVPLFDLSNIHDAFWMFQTCSLTSVPLFNISSCVSVEGMFAENPNLVSVPKFDTSNVTDMIGFLGGCTSLTSLPTFNVSKVTTCVGAFSNCPNVQTGASALYSQLSSRPIEYGYYNNAFGNCGSDTLQGQRELALIPTAWGGTLE